MKNTNAWVKAVLVINVFIITAAAALLLAGCGGQEARRAESATMAKGSVGNTGAQASSAPAVRVSSTNQYYEALAGVFSRRWYDADKRLYAIDDVKAPSEAIPALMVLKVSYLSLLRNEISARHGETFNEEYIEKTLVKASWYQPGTNFNFQKSLNDLEKKNVRFIQKLEQIDKEGPEGTRQIAILLTLPKEEMTAEEAVKVWKATGDRGVLVKINPRAESYYKDLGKLGWEKEKGVYQLVTGGYLFDLTKEERSAYANWLLKMKEGDRFMVKYESGDTYMVEDFIELPLSDTGEGRTVKKWDYKHGYWSDTYFYNRKLILTTVDSYSYKVFNLNGKFESELKYKEIGKESDLILSQIVDLSGSDLEKFHNNQVGNWVKTQEKLKKVSPYSDAAGSNNPVTDENSGIIYLTASYRPDYSKNLENEKRHGERIYFDQNYSVSTNDNTLFKGIRIYRLTQLQEGEVR